MKASTLYLYIAIAAALTTTGCTKKESETAPRAEGVPEVAREAPKSIEKDKASVRFVNAYDGTVDLFFGETKPFAAVGYKAVTPYKELREDWAQFKLRTAGKDTADPLARNIEAVSDGERYTIVALAKEDGNATLKALKDDEAPAPDKAKIRFVHVARDIGDVDVVQTGKEEPIFDGVDFNSMADYKTVDPMKGTLQIRKDNETRALARIANVNLEAGKKYTFVITSKAKGAVEVIRLTDEPGA